MCVGFLNTSVSRFPSSLKLIQTEMYSYLNVVDAPCKHHVLCIFKNRMTHKWDAAVLVNILIIYFVQSTLLSSA